MKQKSPKRQPNRRGRLILRPESENFDYDDLVNYNAEGTQFLRIQNSSQMSSPPAPRSSHAYLIQQQMLRKNTFAEENELVAKGDVLIPSAISSVKVTSR